jgi:hypothetical protein
MKKIILSLLVIVAFGCNTNQQKALDFNNKIAGYSKELGKRGEALTPILRKAIETKNFTACTPIIKDLENYIKLKTIELEGLQDINGSENLKAAMRDFMRFEKELADEALFPFTKFDSTTSADEIQNAISRLVTKSEQENTYLQKVRKEQRAYAAKNGFRIEDKK